jgi:hypothetical protein
LTSIDGLRTHEGKPHHTNQQEAPMRPRSVLKGAVLALAAALIATTAQNALAADRADIVAVAAGPASEYPFVAALQTSRGRTFCGATLVDPSWVITAKHCLTGRTPGNVRVRLGGVVSAATKLVSHPTDDLAAVKLAVPSTVAVVPLAYDPPVTAPLRLLAFSGTTLRQLDTEGLYPQSCGLADHFSFCSSNVPGFAAAPFCDGGGPALIYEPGGWKFGGVAARPATAGACATAPAVYTNVAVDSHKIWILWDVLTKS